MSANGSTDYYPCIRRGPGRYERLKALPLDGPGAVLTWLLERGYVERVQKPGEEPYIKGWGQDYFACAGDQCHPPT